ncbi:MAG: hypothetical protein ACYC09_02150 [Bacteroidota bacterium]
MFILSANGCDRDGLNPNQYQEPGISGTISFAGPLPPSDSLRDLRIVAVPYYPVDTTFAELFDKIVNKGIIPFSEGLSAKAVANGSIAYHMNVKPQTYHYVAVVQLFGINFLQDWRVVSIYGYTTADPTPKPVVVTEGTITDNINFVVDFSSVPVQPFTQP